MGETKLTKICSKCQEEKPASEFHKNKKTESGLCCHCKKCVKKKSKEYYNHNAEKIKKYQKEHRLNDIDKNKKILKKHYKKNKEIINKRKKQYRLNNPEKIKKYNKKYKTMNREAVKEQGKAYRQTPRAKGLMKDANSKRRALMAGARVENFKGLDVLKRDRYICQSCGIKTLQNSKNIFHPRYPNVDHIIPLSKGGDHSMKNTQCLCRKCNCEKHNNQKQDQLLLFGY